MCATENEQILAPLDCRLGDSRICRVSRILDPGAVLLGCNFSTQNGNHVTESLIMVPSRAILRSLSLTLNCFLRSSRLVSRILLSRNRGPLPNYEA